MASLEGWNSTTELHPRSNTPNPAQRGYRPYCVRSADFLDGNLNAGSLLPLGVFLRIKSGQGRIRTYEELALDGFTARYH